MTTPKPRWIVRCSCGWDRKCVSQWAAESVAKMHPRLADPATVHTVSVDAPPDLELEQPDLPME
jgi:hypothetical protein